MNKYKRLDILKKEKEEIQENIEKLKKVSIVENIDIENKLIYHNSKLLQLESLNYLLMLIIEEKCDEQEIIEYLNSEKTYIEEKLKRLEDDIQKSDKDSKKEMFNKMIYYNNGILNALEKSVSILEMDIEKEKSLNRSI